MHLSYERTVPRPQKQFEVDAEDLLDLRPTVSESRPQSLFLGLVPPLELLALSSSLDEQVFLLPVPMATGSP